MLPLCPDKGRMTYNLDGAVSDYLRDDRETLRRLENLFRWKGGNHHVLL